MKKAIFLFSFYLICNSIFAQNLEWAKGIGGSGLDQGRSVTNDAQGNVYCTGKFTNTVDFNPGAGVFNLTAVGSYDSYVLKLDAAGNFLAAADGAVNTLSTSTVQYSLDKRPAQMWNLTIGGQFQLNKHWMIRGEYGFLGTRQQFFTGLQYRFGL